MGGFSILNQISLLKRYWTHCSYAAVPRPNAQQAGRELEPSHYAIRVKTKEIESR
jgi:hypothetical protein